MLLPLRLPFDYSPLLRIGTVYLVWKFQEKLTHPKFLLACIVIWLVSTIGELLTVLVLGIHLFKILRIFRLLTTAVDLVIIFVISRTLTRNQDCEEMYQILGRSEEPQPTELAIQVKELQSAPKY